MTLPILQDYWQLHPVAASRVGVQEYDAALPDLSPAGMEARREWRSKAVLVSESLDRLDARVLRAELAGEDVEADWQLTSRAPALYVEEAMQGLHVLLARRQQPDLRPRLEAVPRLLAQGRANLRPELVPAEWLEIALVACDGAQRFLNELPDSSAARQAVAEYARFLRNDVDPGGSFALGQDRFEHLLREKHGLGLSADDVYRHGEELARALTAELEAESATWRQDIEALKSEHPTPETLLQTYEREAARARAFVKSNHLVPMPPGDVFEVRPTAPFLRATMPLGHFDRTPPFAPDDNVGVLYITPIDTALPLARQAELLEAHCFTAVRAICLHETFPGHHVQLWHAKLHGTPLRKQFHSSLFAEGWALYCEELMEEAGYYDTPGLRLWRLKNAMWRAVRLMVDVGLHCRGQSLESAARPLVELGGLEPNTARGEALRYTTSPTQPSSYVLGRDRIVELRHRAERQPGFVLADFHERLLAYGTVPPTFIPDDL